ncbi:putative reverse transcriptase domain-containing protein [Tanacetum coccineum]
MHQIQRKHHSQSCFVSEMAIHHFDVKNVFFDGDHSETVYMYMPPGYALRVGFSSCLCDSSLLIYQHRSEGPISDPTLYRSLVVGFQYLTFTRPNISYVVQHVFHHMHDPREPYFVALKRVLRYVCSMLEFGLQLYASATGIIHFLGHPNKNILSQDSIVKAECRSVANAVVVHAFVMACACAGHGLCLCRSCIVLVQVMAAPIISISSDSSKESVRSHAPQVIRFGDIPVIIPEVLIVPADPIAALEVGTVLVVSPTRVLDLVDYSPSSDSDPSEDSLPPFPLAPVVAPPGIHRRSGTLIRPGEAIHFGLPYRTHLNGPRRLLTARKRVRPIPARRLAWRRVSHHSSDRHSLPDSSSFSSPSDHSLSGHTPPDTTDVDTSTPPRFVHRSLARTPRHSSSFERSSDSSSPSSRPSRKRCRSLTASVPSSTYVSSSIAPTPADILPPRKRFRDSYSPKDSGEEHMEVDTADVEAVADVGISDGVVAHPKDSVDMKVEIAASDVRKDDEEFEAEASAADTREIVVDPLAIGDSSESSRRGIHDLEDTIYDIFYYMSEVCIDRITKIETTQRQLETSQLVASRERASLVDRIESLRLEYLKVRAMLSIEKDRIDSLRWHMAHS